MQTTSQQPGNGVKSNTSFRPSLGAMSREAEANIKKLSLQSVGICGQLLDDRYDEKYFILEAVPHDQLISIMIPRQAAARRSRIIVSVSNVQKNSISMVKTC